MGYIGHSLQVAYPNYKIIDDISGSFNGSTTSFALLVSGAAPVPLPLNSQQCLISVAGVLQRPDDTGAEGFRLSGGNIVFSSAPASGADFFGVILAGADYVNAGGTYPDGSAAVPSITFTDDTDTGLFRPSSGVIGIACNSTSAGALSSTGLQSVLGSAANPSLSFVGDTNTGIFSPGADTIAFTEGGVEAMRIDSSARLLVGTSSSDWTRPRVVIVGNPNETTTGPGVLYLQKANGTVSAGDKIGEIAFSTSSSNVGVYAEIICEGDATGGSADFPGRLVFKTCADGASSTTERMRIWQNGTITFGSNASTDPIGSSLSGQLALGPSASSGSINYFNSNNPALKLGVSANGDIVTFFRNQPSATSVGSISVTTTATAYNTSSDYRLKENIIPLVGAIDRLNQLQVHRFNFIADPDKIVDGFLAHEAQAVVPECVTGEKDAVDDDGNPVYQGIDQSKLVPLLTAALQEALQKIEDLEGRLTAAGI